MYIILKATEGPYVGKSRKVLLKGPNYECLFGRTVSSDDGFKLELDPEISGHHLTFKWNIEKDCLQVRDEKSFNGSALNFKIMTPMKFYDVKDGSVLKTGKSTFTILIRDNEEEPKSLNCYCPVCFKDISLMTETGRTQHVNNCIPEKKTVSNSVVEKAQSFCVSQSYDSMSLKELTSLKQRMEDTRIKLEIEYQKLQKVFYSKKAQEVLNPSRVEQSTRKRESFSKTIEMIYSVPEEEDHGKSQHISTTQAQLTGGIDDSMSEEIEKDSLSSDEDSIITQEVLNTPTKNRRLSMPNSPSKGVAHINPRRSSILVSPSKHVPSPTNRLSVSERNQRLQFYMKQIPQEVQISQGVSASELQTQIYSILSRSSEEIKETIQSLQEQEKQCTEESKPIVTFLLQISLDLIKELESIRPVDNRRQAIIEDKKLETPRKSIMRSPIKKRVETFDVSEDTMKKIHMAIEKDKNLSYQIEAKQAVSFDHLVSCIRKSLPTLSTDIIKHALDKERIKYVMNPL